jgi:hypothetical protein
MSYVFGKIELCVLIPVESDEETTGLLQANYEIDPDRMVNWELVATDCKGHKHKVKVCECDSVSLETFIS